MTIKTPNYQELHDVSRKQQQRSQEFRRKKQQFMLRDNMVLHETVCSGDEKRLIQLMPLVKTRVYDINAPDEDWSSRTALHVAAFKGKKSIPRDIFTHNQTSAIEKIVT